MYVVRDNTGKYCKLKPTGKVVFGLSTKDAQKFHSEREASDFIRKHWKKRAYNNFKVVCLDDYISEFQTVDVDMGDNAIPENMLNMPSMQKEIHRRLTKQIEILKEDLRTCERKLCDVQHYLRHPDTELNMQQSYLTIQKLQHILRERAETKRELQRLHILRAETSRAFSSAESFEYDEYKNKAIPDIEEYLFSQIDN